MEYKVESSKMSYQGKAFDVRTDLIRLPDGRVKQRDIVEHAPAVTIIPVDAASNIWFIWQYRHSIGKKILELPAGVMEADETPIITARRELREEIGMSAKHFSRIGEFYLAPGYSTEYMYVFLAEGMFSSPLEGDDDEFIEVEHIPLTSLQDQGFLIRCKDAKTLAALFIFNLYNSGSR